MRLQNFSMRRADRKPRTLPRESVQPEPFTCSFELLP
jgi:hypothetical protein